MEKGKLVEDSIRNLINGLNGGEGFGADIMTAYRDALDMHEQNFHKAMISLNKILTAAWGAYGVYANLRSISEEEKSDFIQKAQELEKNILRRWNKALLDCRNEGKVSDEMKGIMRDNSAASTEKTSDLILNFLTGKYSSRAWFVMVYNDISGSGKHSISGNMHSTLGEGGKNAVAYSVNKNFLETIIPNFISLRDILKTDNRFQGSDAKVVFDALSEGYKEYEFAVVSRGNGLEGTWTHGLDVVFENSLYLTYVALPVTEQDQKTAIEISSLPPVDLASFTLNKPFWILGNNNNAINWQEGSDGQVMYSENCDFYGFDIGREPSKAEDCGGICVARPDCNHFTYQKTDSYCYLKSGKDIPAKPSETSLCGWVQQRNGGNGNKIEWKEGSDGRVMWSEYCDFHGHDIDRQESKPEDCGDICASRPGCNHFTYQKIDSFCYLKSGKNIPAQPSETTLCGWVI